MVLLFDFSFKTSSAASTLKKDAADPALRRTERCLPIRSGATTGPLLTQMKHFAMRQYHYLLKPRETGIGRETQPKRPCASLKDSGSSCHCGPRHVVFLANGLAGTPSNWNTILKELAIKTDSNEVLVYASRSNTRLDTFDGIDKCGERLADEIRAVVAQHPTLERFSAIGHSMGGLLLRYATAALFNPEAQTIAGLAPAHFITMATPHLGCDGDGVAQVPFFGWAGPLSTVLQRISVPTARAVFRRTGLQFFRADVDDLGTQPLLIRMTQDDKERGLYFYSTLKSFKSRTAYANTGQDHLVGWSNSSLRFKHELPQLPNPSARGKGVILQDDIMAAFRRDEAQTTSKSVLDVSVQEENSKTGESVEGMLIRLQQLPWRRIDVDFSGSPLSILSHNHIQARWNWINPNGRSVAIHLAEQLVQLEDVCKMHYADSVFQIPGE